MRNIFQKELLAPTPPKIQKSWTGRTREHEQVHGMVALSETILAALFCTLCSLSICELEIPRSNELQKFSLEAI